MKNKINHIFFISFIIFIGCNNSSKIEGHWHFKSEIPNSGYWTLDLINQNDSIAYSNKYTFTPYSIIHSVKEKELITGDCGGLFNYKVDFNGKKIYLKNAQNYGDYIGEKHILNSSHILEDYLKDLLIKITFPRIANPKINFITFEQESLIENIIIGKPKYSKDVFFKDEYRIQVRNKFIDINNFDEFIESVKEKYLDKELKHLKFRFISDENTPVNLIKFILKKLKNHNFEKNYLTYLKRETKKTEEIFEYINFNSLDLKKDKKVHEIKILNTVN